MTWTKLSDDYSDDCWTLSDAAFRLHTEALIWSNRKLLDCVIPKGDLVRFSQRPDAAEELVAVGWWTEEPKHFVVHHHSRYQRGREDVIKIQQRNVKNGSKSNGRPKGPPRETWDPDRDAPAMNGSTTNPDGLPDGNPKGQDGTGLARKGSSSGTRSAAVQQVALATHEVSDHPPDCPCNDCWVVNGNSNHLPPLPPDRGVFPRPRRGA